MLELLLTMNCSITVLLRVVANERALFATFELKLDMGSSYGCHDLNVDDACNLVSWLVEGILSLELDFALGELAPFILEEKHL